MTVRSLKANGRFRKKPTKQRGQKMIYVGMDISSKDFMIHAVNERKKVKLKGSIAPTKASLRKLIAELGIEKKIFIFEAGNQMKWIADFLKKENQEIHVVHPNEVKWITQSGGKKTDKVDAKKLAELGRADMLPRRVHIADGKARDEATPAPSRGVAVASRARRVRVA